MRQASSSTRGALPRAGARPPSPSRHSSAQSLARDESGRSPRSCPRSRPAFRTRECAGFGRSARHEPRRTLRTDGPLRVGRGRPSASFASDARSSFFPPSPAPQETARPPRFCCPSSRHDVRKGRGAGQVRDRASAEKILGVGSSSTPRPQTSASTSRRGRRSARLVEHGRGGGEIFDAPVGGREEVSRSSRALASSRSSVVARRCDPEFSAA